MSEPEKFVERWSRLKRERARDSAHPEQESAIAATAAPSQRPVTEQGVSQTDAKDESAESVNFANLPDIDSIDATSDIRAFLQAGVPVELKRAALRRAWSADPNIRDFIGLAENDWDFNAVEGVPGFGALPVKDAVTLLSRMMGPLPSPQEASRESKNVELSGSGTPLSSAMSESGEAPASNNSATEDNIPTVQSANEAAKDGAAGQAQRGCPANTESDAKVERMLRASRRRHGGALPK